MTQTTDQERAQALAEKHGATSYRNRADTSNPAFGFTLEQLQALIVEVEQAVLRTTAEPVPQWGKAGTCDWYDGYADHSDGGGPYKERVLYTAPQAPAPKWDGVINPSDFIVNTFSQGSSGWIQKPGNCVRITHVPTGLVEEGTEDRSVHGNKAVAWERLCARLEALAAAPQPVEAAPVQLPEPCGIFNYGKDDRKPTYHHGETDKEWLNKVLDGGVTGGPHRSEFAYTEQQVRTLLASRMQRHPLTDSEIESATGAKQGTALFLAAKGFTIAVERAHHIRQDQP